MRRQSGGFAFELKQARLFGSRARGDGHDRRGRAARSVARVGLDDPDIGIGQFWVVLDPAAREPVAPGTRVRVGVRPASGRLPEVIYDATPQSVRRGERHYAEVAFDEGEWWDVRIVIGR